MKHLIVSGVFALGLLGCSKKEAAPQPQPGSGTAQASGAGSAPAPVAEGSTWYRATLGADKGTPIPFFLEVPAKGDEAFIVTGPDRVRATLVSRPPKLDLAFEIYRTKIVAAARADGVLEGSFESTSGSWGKATLGFAAEPIAKPDPALRFPAAAGGPDPVGVWKLALPDQGGKLVLARGAGSEVTGHILFQSGNQAFLSGSQEGKTVRLSAFDGTSPYLLVIDLDDAGKQLTGNWTAGQDLAWKDKITGERSADFTLELKAKLASARPKLKLPQLAKPPYAGKPVIVELGGSWCAACGHAAAKLHALKDKYAKDGLEVLMLLYEFTDDTAYNKAQAELFKTKYNVTWEVVPIDGDLEKYNDILPTELQNIDASGFPITIFVARDGGIEGFHSAFPPESWGAPHAHAIAEYDRLTAKIVASPPK
jgi:thiol-disulfide isomerase/thioredoxin